jgi:TonB-linked SusC/RagA family outer membrane protein
MNLKIKLSLVVILLFNVAAFAQNSYTLKGKVISATDKLPLPGVNIQVKNSKAGTLTDMDGNYTLSVSSGNQLEFTYIGFAAKTVTISNQTKLDVVMSEGENQLEQVVVIGYGTQKKGNLTGSISKVTNKDLDQIPASRVDDALIGQVAGVNIQQTNPGAGAAPTIKVRGQGSISFSSSPLIVIDGIAVGTDADFLASMDMHDVESVEILKDASSSAIYGSRGANGVIMITTKKGKEGVTKFAYNTYTGYKFVPRTDILSTPAKWSQFVLDNNNGVLTDQMKMVNALGTHTDWEKVMFDGGIITDHNLSVSGGSESTKFRASLGYNSDEGVLLTDNFEKINLRLNVDTKSKKIEYGVMINPSITKQRVFAGNVIDAIRQSSWLPIYLDENNIHFVNKYKFPNAKIGDYASEMMFVNYDLATGASVPSGGTSINVTANGSPYSAVSEVKNVVDQTKVYANTYFKFNFTDHFNFKQTIGGDYRNIKTTSRTGVLATRNGAADARTLYNSVVQNHLVLESLLSYNRNFGKHIVSAIAGYSMEDWATDNVSLTGGGYVNDYIETIASSNVGIGGGSYTQSKEKLVSYLTRVNYSYDDRYLLSLSFRTDGSSKFGTDTKFGSFPSVSLGWRVSNEKFLENNKFIKELKLRASYGATGSNSDIGEYDYIGLINPIGTALTGTSTGYNATNISNPNLSWEKLVEFNPGVDASFFGGVLGLSLDYYIRTNKDLLINLPIPGVTGFGSALLNKGKVENRGFELELRSTNIRNDNFLWTSALLLTHNKNTLLDFAGSNGLVSIVDPKRAAEWIALEGHPISSFYGYAAGNEIDIKYLNNPLYPINSRSQDIYVKDLNGDGVITAADKTILGDAFPDLVWSFTNNFKYKKFDLSLMFQGSAGAKVRNMNSQYLYNEFNTNMDYNSSLPNPSLVRERIFTSNDIQDASYVALRNLNFGYTFSADMLEQFKISKLRLYLGAQNLLYVMAKNYVGYNPEGMTDGAENPLTFGYQKGSAPMYKTVSFGLNIEF